MMNSFIDFLKVSRPGWWIVSIWLYVAPAQDFGVTFWGGLAYVCLPLNAAIYGLNDYADVELDVGNERKGNWVFGPKGMTRLQLLRVLQIAVVSTFIPLVSWGWREEQAIKVLAWYALAVVINVAYNFPILGHLSGRGPWEILLVYVGFGMVTILSYWLNGSEIVDSNLVFGCSAHYWIHLGFLVLRTQLWTEYMDYESDNKRNRKTTVAKMPSKQWARCLVLSALLLEVAWNWHQLQEMAEWRNLFAFSILGVVSFVGMEYAGGPKTSSLVWLALLQGAGGLWLIQDSWQMRLFVS
jgi:4-hydroxybenzoate polyprenyltransferase